MQPSESQSGYSLLELLLVLAIVGILAGISVPQMLASLDDYRVSGAARYVATRIQRTRMEAINRSTAVAVQFLQDTSGYSFGAYVDGNGDGVRTQDIRDAVDPRIGAVDHLSNNFSGVEFGLLAGLPAVDAGGVPPGTDPIKLGVSNILSYSPSGTSSSGSLYLRGRGPTQYVVRVFGDTGRVRILKFNAVTRQWKGL
jgi:prepilin-type N-terminal cleavage/methylation domain-containing protein